MSDEKKSIKDLLADYGQNLAAYPWTMGQRELIHLLEADILARFDAVTAERDNANAILQQMHAEVARLCAASGKLIDGEVPDIVALDECMGRMQRETDRLRDTLDDWQETHRQFMAERGVARCKIEGLRADVEGLRAERDHHRQANEALRERVANHIAAFEAIARVGCYEAPQSSCYRHGSDPEEFCAACLAELMLSDRDGEQLASELDRLRERVAGLEDAERIAWALSNTVRKRFDLPCLTLTDPAISVSVWVLCVNGQKRYFTVEDDEGYFIPADKYPRITPKARALIDAAREKGGAE